MRDIICDERHFRIAEHYSEHDEYKKMVEEMRELWGVISPESTGTPGLFKVDRFVEEGADVINTIIHVAIQRAVLDELLDMVDYKLDRQIERMSDVSLQEIADRILQAGVEKDIIKMLTGKE